MQLNTYIEKKLLITIYKRCRLHRIKNDTVKGIFFGNNEYKKTKDPDAKNSFEGILSTFEFCKEIEDLDEWDLAEELKSLCRKYLSSKKTIVSVSSELIQLLKEELDISIELEIPDFNYENAIERQLFLIKFLHHDENHSFDDACEYLWMYNREKILDDIGDIKKGLSFLGKGITLEIDKNNNEITSFPTGHLILLVENMGQVFVQLEGLRKMANGATELYAIQTAKTIWNQLSDYAKQRVFYVIENLYESDIQFYHDLDKLDDNELFKDENSLSRIKGSKNLLYFMKNGYDFYIVIKGEDHKDIVKYSKFNEQGKSTFDTFCLIDIDTSEEYIVRESDIVGCARKESELYAII